MDRKHYCVSELIFLFVLAAANARLIPQAPPASAIVPHDPLDILRSWTINRESGHCIIVASTEPTSVDPSLFQSIQGAIEDINKNITSIRLRQLNRDIFDAYGANGLVRSSSWRYEACKSACRECRRLTCAVYSCSRVRDSFERHCRNNCKDQFD